MDTIFHSCNGFDVSNKKIWKTEKCCSSIKKVYRHQRLIFIRIFLSAFDSKKENILKQ